MTAPALRTPKPRQPPAMVLLGNPQPAIRKGGGQPSPSDTVEAKLTPGETVIDKDLSEEALAPLVTIFQQQGHVSQKDVEKYLYPILQNLEAGEGDEQGFAGGGLVNFIRGLFVNPNVAKNQADIAAMKQGSYAGAESPPVIAQPAPVEPAPARREPVYQGAQALLGRTADIDRKVREATGYAKGGEVLLGFAEAGGVPDKKKDQASADLAELGKQYENDPSLGLSHLSHLIPGIAQQPSGMRFKDQGNFPPAVAASSPLTAGHSATDVLTPPRTVSRYTRDAQGNPIVVGGIDKPVTAQPDIAQPAKPNLSPQSTPSPSALDPQAALMGPPVPLKGSASGTVFKEDQGTNPDTQQESRQYLQNPDDTVVRADGKPMGGSFTALSSVTDKDTGNKVMAAPGGGQFTYDKEGKLLDYTSPMTQAADARAQAAGFKDRNDYLANANRGGGGMTPYSLLAAPTMSRAQQDNERRFGADNLLGDLQDRLWMGGKRSTANAMAELLKLKNDQMEGGNKMLNDRYGHELAAQVGHERNAVDAEGNQIKGAELLLGKAKGQGQERLDRLKAEAAQEYAGAKDDQERQSVLAKYGPVLQSEKSPARWMGMEVDDPNAEPDIYGNRPKRAVAYNPVTGETRAPQWPGNTRAEPSFKSQDEVLKALAGKQISREAARAYLEKMQQSPQR